MATTELKVKLDFFFLPPVIGTLPGSIDVCVIPSVVPFVVEAVCTFVCTSLKSRRLSLVHLEKALRCSYLEEK